MITQIVCPNCRNIYSNHSQICPSCGNNDTHMENLILRLYGIKKLLAEEFRFEHAKTIQHTINILKVKKQDENKNT